MQSLFSFQQAMANNGSTTAMMKLGEMYEQGVGTKQDLDKAIEMYRKAKAGGHTGADAAIARVLRTKQSLVDATRREKVQAVESKRQEQERQRAEAERQAQAARQAELERQAREKAHQEALARKRAEQARRDAEAKAKADQAARARAAAAAEAARRAQQQAQQEKVRAEARKQQQAKAAAASDVPATNESGTNTAETFKSDPCKGPAARVMSICK